MENEPNNVVESCNEGLKQLAEVLASYQYSLKKLYVKDEVIVGLVVDMQKYLLKNGFFVIDDN